MHDNIGTSKDPHMKSPMPKYILIVIIIALIVIVVAPKVVEIANDNIDDVENRAEES